MKRLKSYGLLFAVLASAVLTGLLAQQATQPAQTGAPPKTAPAASPKSPPSKTTAAPAPMTNQDVIRLVKANISEDLIIAKIKQSKTKFDVSVDGLVALKGAGVSDRLISVIMSPAPVAPPVAAPATSMASPPPAPKPAFPPSNVPKEVAATETKSVAKGAKPVGGHLRTGQLRSVHLVGRRVEAAGKGPD